MTKEEKYYVVRDFLSQPGVTFEVTKIHPYDLFMMIEQTPGFADELIYLYDDICGIFLIQGKAYFQTTEVEPSEEAKKLVR